MAALFQEDEIVARYQIFGSDKAINSVESSTAREQLTSTQSTASSSSTFPGPIGSHPSIFPEPTWSFAGIVSPDDATPKNLITIYKAIKVSSNNTHHASVVFGTWEADFLCKYDEPAGVVHSAKVMNMNASMRAATGWSRQDVGKELTREEKLAEQRADVRFGVYKKPRSKTVGLCTVRETDDTGWHFLELRTSGDFVHGDESGKAVEKRLMSSFAKRLVGSVKNTLLSAAELERLKQIGETGQERNEDEDLSGKKRKRDGDDREGGRVLAPPYSST